MRPLSGSGRSYYDKPGLAVSITSLLPMITKDVFVACTKSSAVRCHNNLTSVNSTLPVLVCVEKDETVVWLLRKAIDRAYLCLRQKELQSKG